jgi:hypothetical protein
MRVQLTVEQSRRWVSGDPEAWQVELEVMRWAKAEGVTEPVVAFLSTGPRAFAFRLEEEEP